MGVVGVMPDVERSLEHGSCIRLGSGPVRRIVLRCGPAPSLAAALGEANVGGIGAPAGEGCGSADGGGRREMADEPLGPARGGGGTWNGVPRSMCDIGGETLAAMSAWAAPRGGPSKPPLPNLGRGLLIEWLRR